MKSSTLILTTLVLLSGCFSIGRDFQSSATPSWVKPGETTKAQIQAKLGDPFRVGMDAGDPTWSYGFYQYRLFGMSDNKDLVFRFDPAGKVKTYTLNTTYPEEQEQLDPSLKPAAASTTTP
jgi:outer membrane protein assembly factor BamE (lipoprotein component of BamABCDE complex)